MNHDVPSERSMNERRPLGNVLVATDFSDGAMRAVERAVRIPISPGSVLTILHVMRPGYRHEDRTDAERALDHAASLARDGTARAGRDGLDVFPRLVEGIPFVEIVRAARHGRNELVVVGRHGERTFRELMLGSTAERLIRKGDTSALIVGSQPAVPYARPLVAVDCSDTSWCALELTLRVANVGMEALDVVHAYEPIPESALRRASVFGEAARQYHLEAKRRAQDAVVTFLAARQVGTPGNIALREGDARRVILDVAAQHNADLLALGTHGRSGLAHVLLGSVAEAVIRAASCDVLVARAASLPFELP
jgi:nucleotide-binding universal stress UspA family protein